MSRARRLDGSTAPVRRARLHIDESLAGRWLYIGVVATLDEERDALYDCLQADRDAVGYQRELHFGQTTQHHKAALAKAWLTRAMHPGAPTVRWHVLGIDLQTLNRSRFGNDATLYARFFRTAITYCVKALLPEGVMVTHLVHDEANVASSRYFHWHAPWRMRQDHDLNIAAEKVDFVNSDHAVSGQPIDSTFVQLADVIVGATRLALDATTTKHWQVSVATDWLPLVQRLCDERRCRNPKSRYGYVGRCSISFFPTPRFRFAHDESWLRSAFYVNRRPALADTASGQLSLGV